MEALKKLEKVQAMLSFMDEEQGCSSNDPHSDRFLADFLLFLVQSCNTLKMEKKFHLILQHLPKISARKLEEAFVNETKADVEDITDLQGSLADGSTRSKHFPTKNLDMTKVGLDAMQHANSTLEDFLDSLQCRTYFMFHGLDANCPHAIFKFLPVLLFTESYIYQLDVMNEHSFSLCKLLNNFECSGLPQTFLKVCNNNIRIDEQNPISFESFAPLLHILQSLGLLTERVLGELRCGIEYWSLERKLCQSIERSIQISIGDVQRAIRLKSFDYRILNILLYRLMGEEVNELHMTFLSVSELLGEISDDLYDYEVLDSDEINPLDDVIKNNFNILRMFSNIYGASVAPSMLAKHITEEEEKLKILAERLDSKLCSDYYRRCKDIAVEGRKPLAHAFGTWNIPRVIVDEDAYRCNFHRSNSTIS